MQDLKVTIIQSALFWEDKSANILAFTHKIEAITEKTDIIVLPEMFNTGFSMKPEIFAEFEKDKTLEWMQRMAAKSEAAITGSLMIEEAGKYYNRLYFVEPSGKYYSYNKRHLFRMGGEDNHFAEGSEKLVVNYKNWKINFLICYDLRFPVWAKNNFANDSYDYDILIVVANWPAVRSRVWETLLSARAIENQSYVIGVNRVGADGNGLAHSGNSNIIDPKGVPFIEQSSNKDFTNTQLISRFDLDDFRNKFKVGLDWDNFAINQEPKNINSGEKYSTKNIQKEYNG